MATLSPHLLNILRCPVGVKMEGDDPGKLTLEHDGNWLVCEASGHKYPVRDGIPDMLIEVGAQYKDTAVADLPVPPPPIES
ncbi:MAG: Trm112 family protein [Chloroflexota bacterium]